MPFELMYGQKPVMPIEETIISWTILPWEAYLTREELLALRIRQLSKQQKDIEQAKAKLREDPLKNKEAFDKRHRLHPKAIKEGDWVLVYDSSLDNQYSAIRKMIKRWFGPYEVVQAFDNGTYLLSELDGTKIKVPSAGKRVKLFKRREGEIFIEDHDPEGDLDGFSDRSSEELPETF